MPDEGLWSRARRAVYDEIAAVAMGLFLEKGFEATTIDEIAAAAGISRRSFFRYFGTKEDVVLGHLAADGIALRAALEQRPDDEDAWTALLRSFLALDRSALPQEHLLKLSAMMYNTASLRARSAEKHRQWEDELLPEVRRRQSPSASGPYADMRARAVVGAAIACLDTAGEAWTRANGETPLGDLLTTAFTAVAPVRRD
ncbi:TetR/AcrR family transcriptional regulator [Streptomyces sp. NPDC101062]|uniref:TetR/AcrR family transcriptional regulator n=1 Tax=unclassified Streptomyces TaxID=2593676 RepID=UPI00381608E1